MYYYFGFHFIVVVSWAIFLLQFIKSLQNNLPDRYIFGFLSLFFMLLVLYVGVKLMLFNPAVAKSGGWLHVKLSFDILLMLENLFLIFVLFKRRVLSSKIFEILYWLSYISFMLMITLSMFRPF